MFTSPTFAADRLQVAVSILPQKYFVEKIGGEQVEVLVMVKPGAEPATYEPKPQQMVELARSKIYFAIGVPFETVWLEKMSRANPKMLVVRTEAGIEKAMPAAHRHPGEAEPQEHVGKHDHGIKDPHIWLAPHLVMIQARNILNGLLQTDPSSATLYKTNYKNFIMELVDLDAEFLNLFGGRGKNSAFMVFHPAWGYFARAYGLNQIPVELEGKEPRPADLEHFIKEAKAKGIKVLFVQPQFSTKSAETIAKAVGGQIVFADPLAPNWAENLREVAEKFRTALGTGNGE